MLSYMPHVSRCVMYGLLLSRPFAGCAVLHVFDVSDRMALPPDFSAAVVVVVLLLLLAAAA